MPTSPFDSASLESLLGNLPVMVFRTSTETPWRAEYVSGGAEALTGYAPGAFIGGSVDFRALIHPDDRDRVVTAVQKAWSGGDVETLVYRLVDRSGATRWVRDRTVLVTHPDGSRSIEGILVDVTDAETARAALEERDRQFAAAQRLAHVGSWTRDFRTGVTHASDELHRILGIDPGSGVDAFEAFMSMLVPEDRIAGEAVLERVARERPPTSGSVWRIRRGDGSVAVVVNATEWQYDEQGMLLKGHGTLQDITQRVTAERELAETQSQQAALLQSIPESAWLKAPDGRYVTVNRAYARQLHLDDPGALVGRHASDFFAPEIARQFDEEERTVLERGEPATFVTTLTLDGVERTFETTVSPFRDATGALAGTVGVSRDVTERIALQRRLARAEKMEALGLLSGGIAHDFNNLLSAIIGGAELARIDAEEGSQTAVDLDDIRRAAERGAALTRQLLAFSRNHPVQLRPIDLGTLVCDAEPLLRRLIPDDIGLVVQGAPGTVVRGDASQLEQALINLVVNARDAIREARRARHADARRDARADLITVDVTRERIVAGDRRLLRSDSDALPPGTYAVLVVRDTGSGIAPATLARMFEPFYTTKRVGEGTGLGLATVSSIVSARDGAISVDSTMGHGAAFTIVLPWIDQPAEPFGRPSAKHAGGTETILLVEDELVVRTTASRILSRHGYRVLEARHGEDALRLWHESGGGIDVVITDLRMPELGGRPFVERLHQERPGLPVVLMTGYANTEEYPIAWMERGLVHLPKPVTSEALLASVREALDLRRS